MSTDAAFTITADHPALAGHFPGNPVVPGVLVLEHVQRALAARVGPVRLIGLPNAKFLSPLRPDEKCVVVFTGIADGNARFECRSGARTIARGALRFHADARRAG